MPLPPEIRHLSASDDAEDRAYAAFQLGGRRKTRLVIAQLRIHLLDEDKEVAGVAAQSLALHGDLESLEQMMSILSRDSGSDVTPMAWAVAKLASQAPPEVQSRAREALLSLAARGSEPVKDQVGLLVSVPFPSA